MCGYCRFGRGLEEAGADAEKTIRQRKVFSRARLAPDDYQSGSKDAESDTRSRVGTRGRADSRPGTVYRRDRDHLSERWLHDSGALLRERKRTDCHAAPSPTRGPGPDERAGHGPVAPALGVNVVTFAPRGMHGSEGVPSIAAFVDDIGAALRWLCGDGGKAFRVAPERIAIGGHSLGGGLAMAYAIRDSTVAGVVPVAGNDLGEFARRLRSSPVAVAGLRQNLKRMGAADPDLIIREIMNGEAAYGHTENAPRLANRPILLIGGWDDTTAPIETVVLPFYRALKRQPESEVAMIAYQDGHAFPNSREEIASEIQAWLARRFPR